MIAPYLSELRIFSFDIVPKGWLPCDGRLLPINQNQPLFSLLGIAFGGDGITNFAIPDLRGKVPMHQGENMPRGQSGGEATHQLTLSEIPNHTHYAIASSDRPDINTPQNNFWSNNNSDTPYGDSSDNPMSAQALEIVGNDTPHNNMAPYLVTNICIAVTGVYPGSPYPEDGSWCAEIRMFAGKIVPLKYNTCDGQVYSSGQYVSLFSLLSTFYYNNPNPGDRFALPNLAERAPIKEGKGTGLELYNLGEEGGTTVVTLAETTIPQHTHLPMAVEVGTEGEPTNNIWANSSNARPLPNFFATSIGSGVNMSTGCISPIGNGGSHNNLMPYTVVVFAISMEGVFPPRSE